MKIPNTIKISVKNNINPLGLIVFKKITGS